MNDHRPYDNVIDSPGRDPAQKPLKIWAVWAVFQQDLSSLSGLGGLGIFLEKPLKPLKSCLKNRSKTAHFLRWFLNGFFKQDLSGFWAVFPGRGPRLMSMLSRQNFGMSRLSRPKLGMSRLWRPKHGISRLLRPWWSVATIAPKQRWRDQNIVLKQWASAQLPSPLPTQR